MHPTTRDRITAREVERAILARIATGKYAPDSRLPTCEQFATEMSANKNTVNKAYRALAERGFLRTSVGRGTFVVRHPPAPEGDRHKEQLSDLVGLVVQQGKIGGLSREELEAVIKDTIDRYYEWQGPRVGFIECNRTEALGFSRDLELALSHPVSPLLVEQVLGDPEGTFQAFDILAINVNHLTDIRDALPKASASGTEIVSLLMVPDPDAITKIAHLVPGTRVGIVCDIEGTLATLTALATAANPGIVTSGCLSSDLAHLHEVLENSDVVVLTNSSKERLDKGDLRHEVLAVAFQFDGRSLAQLADVLAVEARGRAGSVEAV